MSFLEVPRTRRRATSGGLLRRLGGTLLFFGLAPAMAAAQGAGRVGQRDAALLTLSALTAADDNGGTDESVEVRDPQYRGVQIYSVLGAAVTLNPQQERFHWQVNASTGVRHYASLHEFMPTGQTAGGSLSFSLGGRTNVIVSEAATYSPTYSLTPFLPGMPVGIDASPAALDYGVVRSPNFATLTSASLSQALTARSTVIVAYGMNRVAFSNAGEPDLITSNASAKFTYRLTKYASLHAGYGRRSGQYDLDVNSAPQETHVDDYDVGVDYSKALALGTSRQTILTFSSGSSIYRDLDGPHYAVTGTANLTHQFGRTGQLGIVYVRGVGFLQGLLAPVFTDAVTASAGKALSRRVRLSSSGGYVFGSVFDRVGSDRTSNNYGAWTGTGQFTVGLTPRTGLQMGYAYYQYHVGDAVRLIGRLPGRQQRQTLFVGLTVGVPLVTERVRTGR